MDFVVGVEIHICVLHVCVIVNVPAVKGAEQHYFADV